LGRIIAIVNQKGGVGKTTTSVNLSASMAKIGKKILVVDIDPQGHTTNGLGISTKKLDYTTYQVIIDNIDMEKAIIKTDYKNLYICPADIDLAGAEVELVGKNKREYQLKSALEKVKDKFDYIFIDCPPSLSLITLNALTAANGAIIPVQCEYYALEGLSRLIRTIKEIKYGLNPEFDIEGVLLTMFDTRTNLSIMVADEVKKYFPKKVYKTVIPRNVRLSEAPSYGQPITEYDPYSRGAECYMELAKEVDRR